MFHHLHLHTEYSALDGMCKIKEYVQSVKEQGLKAAVITDHGNINGAVTFIEECEKNNIKPIVGCEFYVAKDRKEKTKERTHLVLIAKNKKGYENLCKLCSIASIEGFYYRPRIDLNVLKSHKDGLICLSACLAGVITRPLLKGDKNEAYRNLETLKIAFKEDFYLEIMPLAMVEQIKANKLLLDIAKKYKIKIVITNDVHYLRKEDYIYQEMLLCMQTKSTMSNPKRWKFDINTLYLATEKEMIGLFKKNDPNISNGILQKAILNTQEIVDKCENYSLRGLNLFPKVDFLKGKYTTTRAQFCALILNGIKRKNLDKKRDYQERLKEEMRQIIDKGFVDYFLLVRDIIQWAKNKNILVGPGRGSSAGSLVCFLLGITNVDPIIHGTLFFRFIDPNRNDLPDIDVDFEDVRREEVKEYIVERYGKNCVANVGTFGRLKGKLVLKDLCRIYEVPPWEAGKVIPYITDDETIKEIFEKFAELHEFRKKYPIVVDAAIKLEGQVKQFGINAAGVIITDGDITKYCPVELRGVDKKQSIGYDWQNISYMGLLKIDVLGVNFLTVIQKTLKRLKKRGIDLDIEKIDINNPDPYLSMAGKPHTGIFQFETPFADKIAKQIGLDSFKEMCACNALMRPGPLMSGTLKGYIAKKQGKKKIKYLHPAIEKITNETRGEIVYQEQVMLIIREIGGFDWKDTNRIRKLISKKEGTMDEFKKQFIKGSVRQGLTKIEAELVWDEIGYYGSYGFNKSHAVAYSMLSFWCAYLKHYHFHDYMLCFINFSTNIDRSFQGMKYFKDLGYKLTPPKIEKPTRRCVVLKGKIIQVGLNFIKGFGPKIINEMMRLKKISNVKIWTAKTEKRVINSKIKKILVNTEFFPFKRNALNDFFNLEYKEKKRHIDWLYEHCPILFCDNLLKPYDDFIARKTGDKIKWNNIEDLDFDNESGQKGEWILLKGIMGEVNIKDTQEWGNIGKGNVDPNSKTRYCVNSLNDGTGTARLTFYPEIFRKYESGVMTTKTGAPVLVRGMIATERVIVKEFINLKKWKTDNIYDEDFAYKLKNGIKTQEEAFDKIKQIVDNIDRFYPVNITIHKEHQAKNGLMAFATAVFEGDVDLPMVIWPDAFTRWKTLLKGDKKVNMRFSYFKDNKFYLDSKTGIVK
jgi:DNA polymerase-3 subunit alpha